MDMKDIKMRVLYSSDKAKMKTFASALGEAFKCLVDAVPPGFPCEKENPGMFVCYGSDCSAVSLPLSVRTTWLFSSTVKRTAKRLKWLRKCFVMQEPI